jgi:hypothetical protein
VKASETVAPGAVLGWSLPASRFDLRRVAAAETGDLGGKRIDAMRVRLTPAAPVGLSGQRALAHASYSGSARAKARDRPQHPVPIFEVADFRAAPWLVFPPPLTALRGIHNQWASGCPQRILRSNAG